METAIKTRCQFGPLQEKDTNARTRRSGRTNQSKDAGTGNSRQASYKKHSRSKHGKRYRREKRTRSNDNESAGGTRGSVKFLKFLSVTPRSSAFSWILNRSIRFSCNCLMSTQDVLAIGDEMFVFDSVEDGREHVVILLFASSLAWWYALCSSERP